MKCGLYPAIHQIERSHRIPSITAITLTLDLLWMLNWVYIMATDTLTSRIRNIAELSRKAALKLKNGSPKFRDVLRAVECHRILNFFYSSLSVSHSFAMLFTGELLGIEVMTSSGKINFNQILIIQTRSFLWWSHLNHLVHVATLTQNRVAGNTAMDHFHFVSALQSEDKGKSWQNCK